MPKIDILIPVHKRLAVLRAALEALWEQEIPFGWEVGTIICDDGSPGHVADMIAANPPPSLWQHLQVLRQAHQGIAAARNLALSASQADIVLFLGADILLRPGCLAAHIKFHEQHPETHTGALGFVVWDPLIRPTPFMQWMTHGGPQNNFDALLGEEVADPRHYFYGSHVSVKRLFVKGAAFRVGYDPYGWEDLDMGHQLYSRGLQLHVLQQAVALHRHLYTAEAIYRRQYTTGLTVSAFTTANLVSSGPVFTPSRKMKVLLYRYSGLRQLLKRILSGYGERHSLPRLYQWAASGEFWYGVESGLVKENTNK